MFKPTPEHSFYIRALYKRILCEASYFFDDRSRTFAVNRTRKVFKEYKTCDDENRIKRKILDARKKLHQFEKANQGHQKSILRILAAAYGRRGKTKHKLMHGYLYENFPSDMKMPLPLIPHIPHTAPPPPLCYPLQTIVTKHLNKQLEPELPKPLYKPLHRGRQANLTWKWRSLLIQQMEVPLPFEIICELEQKSGASVNHPCYAGTLVRGGPRWMDMYHGHEADPDLGHLYPHHATSSIATLGFPLLIPRFKLQRCIPLPPSPYTAQSSVYATSTLVDMAPTSSSMAPSVPTAQPTRYQHKPRQLRRFYRRLLDSVPLLSPLPSATSLYDPTIKYDLSLSQWAIQSINALLDVKALPDDASENT